MSRPAAPAAREHQLLAAYGAALAALSFLHHPGLLALLLALVLLAARGDAGPLLRRSLGAILVFNLSVSLGYLLLQAWQGKLGTGTGHYLLTMNLRVLLMVFLGFWLLTRVNLLQALAPWPTATLILTLALGQIETYRRLLSDFRLAFCSRHPAPPRLGARLRHGASQAGTLLDKSLAASTEASQALRSRGAFDA